MYSVILFKLKKGNKRPGGKTNLQWLRRFDFSERECDFSLRSRAIRPSDSFGARRKVVLRSEGNA